MSIAHGLTLALEGHCLPIADISNGLCGNQYMQGREKRKAVRVDVHKPARVFAFHSEADIDHVLKYYSASGSSGALGIDCVVNNLSATGARLEFESEPYLQENVLLQLNGENSVIPARVVWIGGAWVGIQFAQPQEWPEITRGQRPSSV